MTKQKDEEYGAFIDRVRTNDIARAVKILDLKDNLDLSRIPESAV